MVMGEDTVTGAITTVEDVAALAQAIRGEIGKAVVGQEQTVEVLLVGLFAGGHVLLEGPPGTAKTLLAQSFARTLGLEFGRIQFTPDLMPGDILGTSLFNFQTSTFELKRGPVFTELLLADEINRTPPKTQAALLQAMQERTVTISGVEHKLPAPFFVLATQNPIEQEGTYPLPEAQLDRFMFNIWVDYPSYVEELAIVKATTNDINVTLKHILTAEQIMDYQALIRRIPVADNVMEYAVKLVGKTRFGSEFAPQITKDYITWGAGPRASQYVLSHYSR